MGKTAVTTDDRIWIGAPTTTADPVITIDAPVITEVQAKTDVLMTTEAPARFSDRMATADRIPTRAPMLINALGLMVQPKIGVLTMDRLRDPAFRELVSHATMAFGLSRRGL